MPAPSAGVADQRVGEPAVLGLELIQGNITAVMGVHIEDNEAIARTGRNGNIGVRMVGPPSVDVLGTNMAKASFTSVGNCAGSRGCCTASIDTSTLPRYTRADAGPHGCVASRPDV